MDGLEFFSRTSDPARTKLASWHSPHSLTWRWAIYWARFKGDERRAHWRLFWRSRHNYGSQWSLLVPWVGRLEGSTQHPMWYRDLYIRLRDERDSEKYRTATAQHETQLVANAIAERGAAPLN